MLNHSSVLHLSKPNIKKAYLHVGLNQRDRDFTRFFWLSKPEDLKSASQIYQFKTVLIKFFSSPFMLNATLHHAQGLGNYNTPIAENMMKNIYVDNIISLKLNMKYFHILNCGCKIK